MTAPLPPVGAALELDQLAATHPTYRFWMEGRRGGPPRFIAERLPGSAVNPVAVVTPDLAELREALGD